MSLITPFITLAVLALILIGSIFATEFSSFKANQSQGMSERLWAYATAEDVIKIIETIRQDPERDSATSVREGPNRGSWYLPSGDIVRFRGVHVVYKSFKDYRIATRWIKKHAGVEPPSNPSW